MRLPPIEVTEGELALLASVLRAASKRYAVTGGRSNNPALRQLQRLKAEFLERVAASLLPR